MGAIFGIVGEGSLAEVRAMGQAVIHRGQCQHSWSPAPNVYFGRAEHRPFDATGGPMTADWQASAEETEFPERFARNGRAALAGLRGSFAMAICGGPAQVWLAVDQIGYKSLYYTVLRGRFAFASEYKALLALADLPLEPDRTAIQHYLATKHPLGGRSFLARARVLQGGNALELRDRK